MFQFTHPGKGATRVLSSEVSNAEFQFTHPGKGATAEQGVPDERWEVSIHAPWEGCDPGRVGGEFRIIVSIHAPWEGCDCLFQGLSLTLSRFNSRTLGRVRLIFLDYINLMSDEFQFTHPGKGATERVGSVRRDTSVSIHAPWEGCDDPLNPNYSGGFVSIHAPWEGCDITEQSMSNLS